MMNLTELKPCPFCGGEATERVNDYGEIYWQIDHNFGCWLASKLGTTHFIYPSEVDSWNSKQFELANDVRLKELCKIDSCHIPCTYCEYRLNGECDSIYNLTVDKYTLRSEGGSRWIEAEFSGYSPCLKMEQGEFYIEDGELRWI